MYHQNTGKPRSKFGKFLDDNNVKQGELAKLAGVNKDTITRACKPGEVIRGISKSKVVSALRKLTNKPVYEEDFW